MKETNETKFIKMNSREFADYVIKNIYERKIRNRKMSFAAYKDEPYSYTNHYGIIYSTGPFDNDYVMIDYYGGGQIATISIDFDYIDDVREFILDYCKNNDYINEEEIYVEIEEE